jgi:CRP-like cAMP-binding protein
MGNTVELFAEGLFKGLALDETKAFLRMCQEKTYPEGTQLFKEQSDATRLYLILTGGIDLHFEMQQRENVDTTIVALKPGDTVGWSAVVPPHKYALSGYCRSKTILLEIDRDTLEVLFETNYHLAFIFMRNIAVLAGERVHHVQDKLAKLLADEAVNGW